MNFEMELTQSSFLKTECKFIKNFLVTHQILTISNCFKREIEYDRVRINFLSPSNF